MKRTVALIAALAAGLLLVSCTSSSDGSSAPSGRSAPTAASPTTPVSQADSRPNFVFVLTDDLAWNLVSHMPHVVGLERAGTTLSKYYVVDSLCCPSRAAIFTGEYPHDDGVFTNHGSDGGYGAYLFNGNEARAFAPALQKAGYRTGFMGKYLNGYQPIDPAAEGWNEWDVTGDGYREYRYFMNQDGVRHWYGKAPSDYLTDVLSAKAGSFIGSSAASGKPFMLEVATFAPHSPYTPAQRYLHAANHVAYPRTKAYDALTTRPPSWLAGRPPLTRPERNQITKAYRQRIEADLAVDDLIGHVESELRAAGVAKNTYLVFSSDNGYHMGEYRLLPGKQTAFDTDIHVPLIVSGPSVPAGHVSTQLASNVDLAPTFESLAGVPIGAHVDGVSLAPLWHGQHPADWQQAVLIEHHGPDDARGDPDRQNRARADPPSYEAIRTATGVYVQYATGEREYYDTVHDPAELRNLPMRQVPPAMPKALRALEHCHGAAACQAAARL